MEYSELFATKDLAEMWIHGFQAAVDMIDDDHVTIGEPYEVYSGEWQVDYGRSC